MAEENDSGLIREIDEELRQEQFSTLAKQYGKYVAVAAVLLIAGVGGFKGWQSYDQGAREEMTQQYVAALSREQADDAEAALDAYAALADGASGDVAVLARMRQARLLADGGDMASAQAIYETIAADSSLNQQYRDLASLYAAVILLDSGAPQDALNRLAPLLAETNPWYFSARETAALAHLESGNESTARELLEQLASDPASPEGIRSRSRQLLDSMGPS